MASGAKGAQRNQEGAPSAPQPLSHSDGATFLGGGRAAQSAERMAAEAFEELNCDWPQVSAAEGSALCSALAQDEFPAWLRFTPKFLRGLEYVCDSGFTKASAAEDPEGDEPAAQQAAPLKSCSTSQLLIHSVLRPLGRLSTWDQKAICKSLKDLDLEPEPAPEALFEVSEASVAEGETMAETEDDDDFEFEPLQSPQGDSFLSSLVPVEEVDLKDAQYISEDWGRPLGMLAHFMRPLTYSRLSANWSSERVGDVLMDILKKLLSHPAGGKCHGLIMHVTFLLRDRMIQEPEGATHHLAQLLALFDEHPSDPFLPCLALHCCAKAVKMDTPLHEKCLSEDVVKLAKKIWETDCDTVARLLACRIDAWPKLGSQGGTEEMQAIAEEEKAVCAVSISILLGGAGQMGGSILLKRGVLRGLLGRLIHKDYKSFYDEYVEQAYSTTICPIALVLGVAIGCSSEAAAYLLKVQQLGKPDFDKNLFPSCTRAAWGAFAAIQIERPPAFLDPDKTLSLSEELCTKLKLHVSVEQNESSAQRPEEDVPTGNIGAQAVEVSTCHSYLRILMVVFTSNPPTRMRLFKKLPQLRENLHQFRTDMQSMVSKLQGEMALLKQDQEALENAKPSVGGSMSGELNIAKSAPPVESETEPETQVALKELTDNESIDFDSQNHGDSPEMESSEVGELRKRLLVRRKAKEICSQTLGVLKSILLDENARKQD